MGKPGKVAVDSLGVQVFQIPTEQPESDGTLQWDPTTAVVVSLRAAGNFDGGPRRNGGVLQIAMRWEMVCLCARRKQDAMNSKRHDTQLEIALREGGRRGEMYAGLREPQPETLEARP